MYIANDKNGERVHIESAKRGLEYFCPICNSSVILKIGPIKAHHYAHAKASYALILGSTIHQTGDLIILIALGKNIKKE